MNNYLSDAQSLQEELVIIRRHLHQNPEVGMELPQTAKYVFDQLTAMGYEPKYIAGTGVTATVGHPGGKTFLLRADMDALPTKEETEVSFASNNGFMHACGHDLHTTMLLGAAKLLKAHEDELSGLVKLMFQPAEETLAGAKAMIDQGILENPSVDAAMMIHVFTGIPLPAGCFIFLPAGLVSSASDWFEIKIQGRGGHGSMPEATIDPLNVMTHIHLALQAIHSRELASNVNSVLTIGIMEGGTTNNVIPDTARLCGTIRTFDPVTQEFIHRRIKEISQGIAAAFRAQAEVIIHIGCPSVQNDPTVLADVKSSLSAAFGESAILDASTLGMSQMPGSEDFSFVSQKVKSLMMAVSAGNSAQDPTYGYPQHHPKAKFDESILWRGAAAYATAATDWLRNNSNK